MVVVVSSFSICRRCPLRRSRRPCPFRLHPLTNLIDRAVNIRIRLGKEACKRLCLGYALLVSFEDSFEAVRKDDVQQYVSL